ncbi:MAG: radical SAM/SPASM domain-containing protein [Phycisphaerae bacterium]
MKIVAAMLADYQQTFWGTPSRLREKLGDVQISHASLRRFAEIGGVDQHFLIVQPRDAESAKADCQACGVANRVHISLIDDGVRPRRELFRLARRWNQTSWRGGLMNTTWYDEFVAPRLCAVILDTHEADAVFLVDAHHAALDPVLSSAMIAQYRAKAGSVRYVFTAAPPGIAGLLLSRAAVAELVEKNLPVGILLTYRPEFPALDPITDDTCLHVDRAVQTAAMRFVADTTRSVERLSAAFGELSANASALQLCAHSARDGHNFAGPFPAEVEIELTTRDALQHSHLYPRRTARREETFPGLNGSAGRRCHTVDDDVRAVDICDADAHAVIRVARELAAYDDRLLVLGGNGDPLLHPRFPQIVREIVAAGQRNIAVETSLLDAPEASIQALSDCKVAALMVRVDAQSRETYAAIHRCDRFDEVIAGIKAIEERRRSQSIAAPLLVPLFTRCRANIHELDAFYDHWIQAVGSATVRTYNDYCGLMPVDDILRPEPPVRGPCRQLPRRLTLLAEGSVAQCSQDVRGAQPLANWFTQSLAEIWDGTARGELCAMHERGAWNDNVLCAKCHEWMRP